MDCEEAISDLLADAQRVLTCVPSGREGAWLIATIALYSDRDLVQVLVEPIGEGVRVSDGGLTLLRLDMQGAPHDTDARVARMQRMARAYGVQVTEGEIADFVPPEQLAEAVQRVSSAAVQMDALMHEAPTVRQTFAGEVESWLLQRATRDVERRPVLPGTTDYRVTAVVRSRVPVFVASVTGASATDRSTNFEAAAWRFEEADLRPGQRVLLLRTALTDYPNEDVRRVLAFATIATWGDRAPLLRHLAAADEEEGWNPEPRVLTSQLGGYL